MESDHHFSSNPDCNNTADVPSFTLRAALSAIPFVSDGWGADVLWFHDNSSQDGPNSKELSVCTTAGFCDGSRNFFELVSVSYDVFVLSRIRLNPLSGRILYHDSVSMRVLWFTVLIENFEISRYQVTDLFCSRYCFVSPSSARSLRNFWFASILRNFGLLGSE